MYYFKYCSMLNQLSSFYLSRMPSKPVVIPDLEVFWLHNGVEHTDNSEVGTNSSFVATELVTTLVLLEFK